MQTKLPLLVAVLLSVGCLAQPQTTHDAPDAPVESAFPHGVCPAGSVYEEHLQYDDGKGCFVISAVCYPEGTPAERVPADCYTKVSLACEGGAP